MKNTKRGSKCGNGEIVHFDGQTGSYRTESIVHIGLISSARIYRYVCCGCGFMKEWADLNDLYLIQTVKRQNRNKNNGKGRKRSGYPLPFLIWVKNYLLPMSLR